jgi:hypothetical protein
MKLEPALLEEAKTCSSCLPWLKHCGAECCKTYTLVLPKEGRRRLQKGEYLRLRMGQLTESERWYYRLHGATVNTNPLGDELIIHLGIFRQDKDRLYITRRCDNLQDDLTCAGYPDNRPDACKQLSATDLNPRSVRITPRCLFKYHIMLKEPTKEALP